jgi:hypothetical protein
LISEAVAINCHGLFFDLAPGHALCSQKRRGVGVILR